jgi:nitrogen-specific signal transduction histidine kinase
MPEQNCSSQTPTGNTESTETMSLIIGRLISLFVHETNNHLATLREASGLGDDIISAHKLSDKEKLTELDKLLCAMDDRIGHAASLVRAFGELGRHMENPTAPLNVNQAIEGIMPFLSKVARQKNLKIRASYGHKLPAAAGDFSCLQCLILAVFDNFCSAREPQATATITTDKTISSVIVSLSADCTATSDCGKQPWPWSALETFATENRFEVAEQQQGGAVTITIKRKE